MQRAAYRVRGLDCAEEVAVLRRAVGKLPGVKSLEFDILHARMEVEYEPNLLEPEQVVAAVGAAGMKASPWTGRKEQAVSIWQQYGPLAMTAMSAAALVAGFLAHWIAHGSLYHALAAGGDNTHQFPTTSMALYVTAAILGAWFVIPKAMASARRLRPDMNLLMTVAAIGAMALGDWFEAATMAFLFALALLLEHWSVERARRSIGALLDITPPTAWCIDGQAAGPRERLIEDVSVGSTILVKPGERIPLDGIVSSGETSVDQSPITGESMPAHKRLGDEVFAGTINQEGAIEVRVTKPSSDTTLTRIIHMVEQAQARRANSQQWVDTFAHYYTPLMIVLAAAVAVLPPLFYDGQWLHWLYQGLVMLVIACPCALVISTPVSIVSALTAAAQNGVLIKGGVFLEVAGTLKAIAMDKTGTLTQGRPAIQRIVPLNHHTDEEVLCRAAALEAHSEHPIARAVQRKAESLGLAIPAIAGFQAIKGRGAEARIEGRRFWIGSHRLMEEMVQETEEVHTLAEEMEDAGHTVIAIGNDQHVCGLISVADSIRDNAVDAVRSMRAAGVRHIIMLTGDNESTAKAIAQLANVDEFKAELLPEDKVSAVESLASQHGKIAMIGDGINDAPAMAAATVGIAMGAMGTDAAIETADIALMGDDLTKVGWLIRHSRRTLTIIKQNIVFALGLKALFIILAVAGAATLWMAIAADMGASLLVIFNALRLLKVGDRRDCCGRC